MLGPYFVNLRLNRSIKESQWWARMPRSVLFVELKACQMANDAGHCHRALTPWWAEVEIKIVIFHEPVAMDAVL